MSLVDSDWLEKNLDKVKLIDSSWHMPQTKRDGFEEYKKKHIPNSIFFDLDLNSKKDTSLPHMLVDKNEWEGILSYMGIKNDDKIIIYDNSDVLSACRCWYNFIYFGHNKNLVYILDGGFEKWVKEKRAVSSNLVKSYKSNYVARENNYLVKDKKAIDENIILKKFKLIDARSKERFEGKIPEPRKGLKSGNIQNSFCIPFNECINKDKTFKNKNELENIFRKIIVDTKDENIVFSCGSGVTACVLALAYSLINDKYLPTIYDGSWAEYGIIKK